MDSIRAVSERMQLMKQAAAFLGASMQRRHDLASSDTITSIELQAIIEKIWSESNYFIKSLDDKRANLEASWIKKSKDLLSSLMFQESSRYFLELLLDLTEKGRSFDPRLVYSDLTLSIDPVKEAHIKAKRPEVFSVTLQHLRDEFQDATVPESTRNDMMLDFVKLTLVATQQKSAVNPADAGAAPVPAGVANPGPRRNDRKRKSDLPSWEREPWLPVRLHLLDNLWLFVSHASVFKGIMTAFGDAHDTSIDSIRVAEGLLAHFVKVFDQPPPPHVSDFFKLYALLTLQRVVGAALDYAVDPMEVNQLDVLHVLRKNKRFLGRVTRTHGHIKHFKAKMLDTKDGLAAINNKDQQEYVFATRTFDDESAQARGDAAAPTTASPPREATGEGNVVSRPVIKVFRSNA
jgi:hypothetical protein